MTAATRHDRLLAGSVLAAMLVLAWFVYQPATGGDFLLDDLSNLEGLRNVDDGASALQFALSGLAGPTGRPLALATFLPQADAIDAGAAAFLRVNILLHLCNALLLAGVLYQLGLARRLEAGRAPFVAVCAATIWLFMPLLASATLMVVQRMTTLSATFVLLGLSAYLYARAAIETQTRKALLGMSAALVLGTTLAVFSKENGVLLPTLVLVIEATLLGRPASVRRNAWRTFTIVFLAVPTVLVLAYVVSRVPYSQEMVLRRDFDGWERLMTEARILWEYLYNAMLPRASAFGPFHDGYPVARSLWQPLTLLAVLGWLAVLVAALAVRRRYPLFAFAALWYLGGHLLESTTLPLELYFEHRNYLPVIGPVYALCALAARVPQARLRLAAAGAAVYLAFNVLVLFSLTTLWGNPPLAAHYWQENFPDSIRAKTTAAGYPISDDWAERTLAMFDRVSTKRPGAAYLRIQELDLACAMAPRADQHDRVAALRETLGSVDFTYTAGTMLSNLISTAYLKDCTGVDGAALRGIARALHDNPRYRNDTLYNQMHRKLLARIAWNERNYDKAVEQLADAIEWLPAPDLNFAMVSALVDSGRYREARNFIGSARQNAPTNPLRRYVWLSQLDELALYVDEVESLNR